MTRPNACLVLLFSVCFFAASLARQDPSEFPTEGPEPGKAAKHLIAFWPSWETTVDVSTLRYEPLTHIIYAFALPSMSGELDLSGVDTAALDTMVESAHAEETKVLISVGGAGDYHDEWSTIAASSTLRTTFANSILSFLQEHDLDGVDIDWEFPAVEEEENVVALFQEVRSVLGENYLITADLPGSGYYGDGFPDDVFQYADLWNVMAYDYTGNWDSSAVGQHSSYEDAIAGFEYYLDRGVPSDKLILGLPFYGQHFYPNGPGGVKAQFVGYKTILQNHPEVLADQDSLTLPEEGGEIYWNSFALIARKTAYVVDNDYPGVMYWEYSLDSSDVTKSLLTAILSEMPREDQDPNDGSGSDGSDGSSDGEEDGGDGSSAPRKAKTLWKKWIM